MNLADTGNHSEHISPGVGTRSLNGVLAEVYQLLFPNPLDRNDVKLRAYCYLRIVEASGFGHYMEAVDSRLTYDLNQDFDHFYTATFDLQPLLARLKARSAAVDRMFHDLPTNDATPQQLWARHNNPVMQVAGVIIGFVQRIK